MMAADSGRTLSELKNIGPVTVRQLATVGIDDVATLRAVGAVVAYRRLKHAFPREINLVCLYALAGALLDLHWNRLPQELKRKLKAEAGGNR